MTLTDDIRNFQVYSALPAEKIKTSREYFVLATLKYSFPEEFAGLRKAEAPDLQDDFKGLGIEVTSGLSPNDERISGESVKYSHAKTEKERAKCLKIIESCGGTRDEFSIGYPVSTASSDREHVVNVFKKKLKKVDEYQKKYGHIGLAMLCDKEANRDVVRMLVRRVVEHNKKAYEAISKNVEAFYQTRNICIFTKNIKIGVAMA